LIATWVLVAILLITVVYSVSIGSFVLIGLIMVIIQMSGGGKIAAALLVILMLLVIGGLWLFGLTLLGAFVTQIVVVEGLGYWKAIRRNWQLIAGKLPRIFGGIALLFLITTVLLFSLAGSLEWVTSTFIYPWLRMPTPVQSLISNIWFPLVGMFMQPFWMICLTLFYYDQRVRREGLDLALLERQLHTSMAIGGSA
jgi:hypothetical protein